MNTNIIGLIGELQACNIMDKSKANICLKYISNFPVRDDRNQFFQVDTIVICTKGVFCVEVKNWEATVYCGSQYFWTVVYKSGEKTVKSPMAQNAQHCRKVSAVFKRDVHSIVLFTDSAVLRDPLSNVMYIADFIPYLAELPDVLTSEEVEKIYNEFIKYKQSMETAMLVDFIFKNLI